MKQFLEKATTLLLIAIGALITIASAIAAVALMVPVMPVWLFSRMFKPAPDLAPFSHA